MRPHEPQSTIVQTLDLVMHPVPWELLRRLRSPAQGFLPGLMANSSAAVDEHRRRAGIPSGGSRGR